MNKGMRELIGLAKALDVCSCGDDIELICPALPRCLIDGLIRAVYTKDGKLIPQASKVLGDLNEIERGIDNDEIQID